MATNKTIEKKELGGGVVTYNKNEVRYAPLSSITPDANQPRKYFNAGKLKTLKDSITKYGIINPIVVQEIGKDNYLIEDGERRYRAAKEMGLKEVPVIIRPATSATDRLVQQFNIQEQHEAWTPVEKAVAINDLSKELGTSLKATCQLLNIYEGDVTRYAAFADLADKQAWIANEIPLDYALSMKALQNTAKRLTESELEKDWTLADAKKLEHRIISLIRTGGISKRSEVNRLTDAFNKNPKMIRHFLDDAKTTPLSIFVESKARGAYHLRNTMFSARYFAIHGEAFLDHRDVKLRPEHIAAFKRVVDVAKRLIDLAE